MYFDLKIIVPIGIPPGSLPKHQADPIMLGNAVRLLSVGVERKKLMPVYSLLCWKRPDQNLLGSGIMSSAKIDAV